jgi:hypothetical protein
MGGMPTEPDDAPVTGACQRTWPISEETGVGISCVVKGVATVDDTWTCGLTRSKRPMAPGLAGMLPNG